MVVRAAVLLVVTLGCSSGGSKKGGDGSDGTDGADFSAVGNDSTDGAPGGDSSVGVDAVPDGADGTEGTDDPRADGQDGTDASDGTDTGDGTGEGVCTPGEVRCQTAQIREVCGQNSQWSIEHCAESEGCFEGWCGPSSCTAGAATDTCTTLTGRLVCNATGNGVVVEECPGGQTCSAGVCGSFVCQAGARACLGFGAVQECKPDGSGYAILEKCEKGGTCQDGKCITACESDIKSQTYRGCEYFAVDLDNIEGGEFQPVALVVSVPTSVENATVSIRDVANNLELGPSQLGVTDMIVAAGTLKAFTLPLGYDVNGSGRSKLSFHVKTSSPATVHQFNPLNGENVYTNDASLLLPTVSGGMEHYALSWGLRADGAQKLRGFVTVVATQTGDTLVTVDTTADVAAGTPESGVNAIGPHQHVSFVLSQGEVLNLEADGVQGADLTGTRIVSDRPVNVFGGHECGNVPLGIAACDHLEQQLLPVAAWGKQVVIGTFKQNAPAQFDLVRVMGGANDVTVETKPPVPGFEKFLLQRGTYVTFSTQAPVEITGDGPILIGHYMIGSSYPGHVKTCPDSGIGDPSLTIGVPTAQYLDEYTVLTPPGYTEDYLNVVAPEAADVTVDGLPITDQLTPIAGTTWLLGRIKVTQGVHTVLGKKKFGLTAYGYDCDVSYAYPGGLKLQILNKPDGGQ